MPAECWWCRLGVAKMLPDVGSNPLGCCYDCQVFACGGHAELEQYAGKWLCLQSAAQAVAAGAGLTGSSRRELVITSPEELEDRLPVVAHATEEDRRFFLSGDGEDWLYREVPQRLEGDVDARLLGHALGIGRFIDRFTREAAPAGVRDFDLHLARPSSGRRGVVPGRLGELLEEAPR